MQYTFYFLSVVLSFTLIFQNAIVNASRNPGSITSHTFALRCSQRTLEGKSVLLSGLQGLWISEVLL